jgi:predicted amidohydrolase YtcJ
VLDRNLFEVPAHDVHKARVLLTLVDGEPIWRDERFQWLQKN